MRKGTVIGIILVGLLALVSHIVVSSYNPQTYPVYATVVGRVQSVDRGPDSVKMDLQILAFEESEVHFVEGDFISIAFFGSGTVESWRAYQLKEGDIIKCSASYRTEWYPYWKVYDSDWWYVIEEDSKTA